MERVIINEDCVNEDYKTAIYHNQRMLRKGECVNIIETIENLYGTFYYVVASDGETFYIDGNKFCR